jgi:hypothetical protein
VQPFSKALRVLVVVMTGRVGLPELAGQIIELLRMRGIDRVGERVDKHLRPFHRAVRRQAKRIRYRKRCFRIDSDFEL